MSRSNERNVELRCNINDNTTNKVSVVPCAVSNYGQSHTAVIVTHPWGPLGGNMHNNVVVASALYFQKMGFATCRFDFLPHQWLSPGFVHVEQVKQAAQMMLHGSAQLDRAYYPESATDEFIRPKRIILIGYSYGSLISGSASLDIPECIATISIAPPFAVQMWLLSFRSDGFLERSAERLDLFRFYVIGDNDNFTSESYFQSVLDKRLPSKHTDAAILSGADHFFRQREKDLMAVIGQWLRTTFVSQCQGDLKRLPKVVELPHASDTHRDGPTDASYKSSAQ